MQFSLLVMMIFSYGARIKRMVLLLLIAMFVSSRPVRAQNETKASSPLKFWIFFSDKPRVRASPWKPPTPMTEEHARQRRRLRGRAGTRDLNAPLSSRYLAALRRRGVQPIVQSRWLNAVSARLSPKQLVVVRALPFVRSARIVGQLRPTRSGSPASPPALGRARSLRYGPSRPQLAFINAIPPLERGIDGKGVRLGFLDTAFGGFDHPVFDKLVREGRLLGVKNFTGRSQTDRHAQSVASLAVGFEPGGLIGPAHGASVLAATTEYVPTETGQEEDFFVAGLEWLERKGVDVVNVSLGYTTFPDDSTYAGYEPDDLDGDTGVTTRAVDRAAALGVTMVIAAGNEGCGSPDDCWYYVGTPADADSAIAVGAAAPDSSHAGFSSFGPTADGRRKPDVAALGQYVHPIGPYRAVSDSAYTYGDGTSFAAPQVAGVACQMLQVNPALDPIAVRRILRQTASRASHPDMRLGWGIVNAAKAVRRAEEIKDSIEETDASRRGLSVQAPYPNPASNRVTLTVNAPAQSGGVRLVIYDLLGRRIAGRKRIPPGSSAISLNVRDWSAGLYGFRVEGAATSARGTFAVTH